MGTSPRLVSSTRRLLLVLSAASASLAIARPAHAGGLFVSERGSRPGARAGAFVAGADDGFSVIYNPAGLIDAGSSVLLDASYVRGTLDYTRKATLIARDPNTGDEVRTYDQTFPTARGTTPFVPIPVLVGSFAITKDIVVALGAYAPLGTLYHFPDTVKGQPAPQRYSVANFDGSALIVTGVWLAYRPIKQLQIGLGPTMMFGKFVNEATFGSCVPDRFICAPEQPEFDTRARLTAGGLAAPSANFGVQVLPVDSIRIGASFDLPRVLKSEGTLDSRLPSSPLFQDATLVGNKVDLRMKLPWVARIGVEVRPGKQTRIELAATYEAWSQHDRIEAHPQNLELRNVALFPPVYRLGDINIERKFQNSYSVKLGGEQTIPLGSMALDARLGVGFEKSAVPTNYVSALSMDANKVILGLGAGFHASKHLRIDASAVLHLQSVVTVPVDSAALYRINPVRANVPPDSDVPVNGGKYVASTQVFSLGARYAF
jgi:long-chain fatty acid transport protein